LKYSQALEEYLSKVEGSTKFEKIRKAQELYGEDFDRLLKDERFAFAHGLFYKVVKKVNQGAFELTDSLDKLLLHPIFGLFFFLFLMFFMFKLAFDFFCPLDGLVGWFYESLYFPFSSLSFGRVFAFKVFIRGGYRWCRLCAYLFAPDRKHSFYPFSA
jgi:ferrous iron transport protein B